MDTEYAKEYGGVELWDALPILLRRRQALKRLRKHLGPKLAAELATLPKGDIPHGDIGNRIYDFFLDEIYNKSKEVWSGVLVDPADEDNPDRRFSIWINEYEGVFYIGAVDYDAIGYFLRRSDAKTCMHCNWDNIRSA